MDLNRITLQSWDWIVIALFFITAGIEHSVQLCGTSHTLVDGKMDDKEKPASLKAFWHVILPLGDSHYFENEAMEDWIYGNHVGTMTVQLGCNISKEQTCKLVTK